MSNDHSDSNSSQLHESLFDGQLLGHGQNIGHNDPPGRRHPVDSGGVAVTPTSLTQEIAPTSYPTDTRSNAIEFRVVRPGGPVRRLRLTGNRYTFGSGDGCSIQLDDETLRPMHAVLLRDAQRILMRAYSVPLEHNGSRVTETSLRMGDIIRMGSYRFELLSAPGIVLADPRTGNQIADSTGAARIAPGPLSFSASKSPDLSTNYLRDKLTDLSQQWHVRHAEVDARESRCDDREAQLHSRETELWSRAENMQRRESFLLEQEEAARQIQETFAATTAELERLRRSQETAAESLQQKEEELLERTEELRLRQQELEQSKAQWNEREREHAEQVAEISLQLEQTNDHAKSATEAVQKMRDEFSALNEQLTELRERHSELQEREVRARSEHERLRYELESARDRAIDLRAASEADRTETEEELARVAAELEKTISELQKIREESRVSQAELSEKLQQRGRELQEAREQAESARQQAEVARTELETARTEAEAAHKEATNAREASERAQQQAAEARAEALEAVAAAQTASSEAHAAEISQLEERVESLKAELVDAQQLHQSSENEAKAVAFQELEKVQADLTLTQQQLANAEQKTRDAEEAAENLKLHVKQLQESVTTANQENSKLRVDYEGANASIRQLELLVDETRSSQSSQHESWADESEQLRKSVEELSIQLSQAHAELEELRASNQALSDQLAAAAAAEEPLDENSNDQGPNAQQWDVLQDELNASKVEIERLQQSHEDSVQKIQSEHFESEQSLREEIEQLRSHVSELKSSTAQDEPQLPMVDEKATSPAVEAAAAIEATASDDSDDSEPVGDWSTTGEAVGGAMAIGAAMLGASAFANETPEETSIDESSIDDSQAVDQPAAETIESDWSQAVESQYPAAEEQHAAVEDFEQQVDGFQHHSSGVESAHAEELEDFSDPSDGLLENVDHPENVVESGESVWRMEGEQASSVEAPAAADWTAADSQGQEPNIDAEDALAKSDWSQADYMAASAVDPKESGLLPADSVSFDPNADLSQDVSWEVEPPEQSVADAIDDIEHNVGQAISTDISGDVGAGDSAAISDWGSDSSAVELTEADFAENNLIDSDVDQGGQTPIDQPMPEEMSALGDVAEPPVVEAENSVQDTDAAEDATDWSQYISGDQQESSDEAASAAQHIDELERSLAQASPSYESSLAEADESVGDPNEAVEEFAADDEIQEDVSQSTGALAEMLIRNLGVPSQPDASDDDEVSPSKLHLAENDNPSQDHSNLSSGEQIDRDDPQEIESTFVMDQSATDNFDADSQAWNMEPSGYSPSEEYSPEPEQAFGTQDSGPALSEDAAGYDDEAHLTQNVEETVSEVAPASEPAPEDDSIEAYMSRLLQRVQGDESAPAQATETPPVVEVAQSATHQTAEVVETPTVEPEPVEQLRDDTPLVPRSKAPERDRNMSAMRELANQSARNAVSRSIRVQARDTQLKASYKASIALAFTMMGIGVYLFVDWGATIKLVMIGAFAVLVAVFGHEAWGLWSEAQRRLSLAEENSDGVKDDREIAKEMAKIADEQEPS